MNVELCPRSGGSDAQTSLRLDFEAMEEWRFPSPDRHCATSDHLPHGLPGKRRDLQHHRTRCAGLGLTRKYLPLTSLKIYGGL